MRIRFLGGAGTVTGSKYLVEGKRGSFLIDCGLFQGLKELRLRNWAPFPVRPNYIDAMVLTHAHIDHSGYIPALVRDGFQGRVHCSPSTVELSKILLKDCAYLQEEEARYANRKGFSKHKPALPLYTNDDAEKALKRFTSHSFGENFEVVPEVRARLARSGHILGSALCYVEDGPTRILFTGDLGRPNDPILYPPDAPEQADFVVVESTYGNRLHEDNDTAGQLAAIINRVAQRQGVVLIPAFSVGRTQSILYFLEELKLAGKIPDIPVYLNSPMSTNVTDLFCDFRNEHRLTPEVCRRLCGVAKYIGSVEESRWLNEQTGPMIIISANGMVSGGRILHHIRAFGPDPRTCIVLTGYQSVGTRGRSLQDGARHLRMFGEEIEIRAEVETLDGLSAHADANEIVHWLSKMPKAPQKVFITHGEPDSAQALKGRIEKELGYSCMVPEHLQTIDLANGVRK